MKINVNVNKHIANAGVIGKAVKHFNQAIAFSMPYIIAEDIPGFSVLHLEQGRVVVTGPDGKRYRVVCSNNTNFDVSPSFSKGASRSKEGISSYKYHLRKVCDGCAFVYMKDKSNVQIIFKSIDKMNISGDGIVNLKSEVE